MVTAAQVKELREKTGAGMMECKKVLNETDGDIGYSTNVVTTSTILFILVVPILMSILNIIHI